MFREIVGRYRCLMQIDMDGGGYMKVLQSIGTVNSLILLEYTFQLLFHIGLIHLVTFAL